MTALILQPSELVQKLIQIAKQKKTTPEVLLRVAVNEFVQKEELPLKKEELPLTPLKQAQTPERKDFDAAFEHEVANFEQLRPELLQQYPNRAVAIYGSQVLESGNDILQVYNAVVDKYGMIPCYVQWVLSETPRKVRIPTAWKVR